MDTTLTKDKRIEIAIRNWAPRFVSSGVPLTDFQEVTAGITHYATRAALSVPTATQKVAVAPVKA